MKLIELTDGFKAKVDDEDYHWLSRFKWYAHLTSNGHRYAKAGHHGLALHRLVLGCSSSERVDHINMDTLDDQKSNLRIATGSQNMMNRLAPNHSTTGYKGVNEKNGVFIARITDESGNRFQLGTFDTAREAALAYDWAARKHHKEFARLNIPDESFELKECNNCGTKIIVESPNDELCKVCKLVRNIRNNG